MSSTKSADATIARMIGEISPSYKKADFTLKGVKTFKGMENDQYDATLYCQGKALAHIWDDGWGGCLNVEYKSPAAEQIVKAFCATQPPMICEWIDKETGKPGEIKYDIELLAGDLMDIYYRDKEEARFARHAKKTCLFRLKGDEADTWRQCGKNLITDADHYRAQQAMERKYGDKIECFYKRNG
jgi:hypothetical protein